MVNDLTGQRFGRWIVLYQSKSKFKSRATMWHCRCDCGNERDISRTNLVQGKIKSCGCYRKELSHQLDKAKRKVDNQGNITHKLCPNCGELKSVDNFQINPRNIDGYSEYCHDCINYSLKRRYSRYVRRAKNANMEFNLSMQEFDMITSQPCTYCGRYSVIYQGIGINGIDRVDSSLGYVTENIVSCCAMCNKMKLNYKKEDWINHMN